MQYKIYLLTTLGEHKCNFSFIRNSLLNHSQVKYFIVPPVHVLNLRLRHGPLLPLLGDVLGAERHLVRDLAPPRLALLVTPQLE